MKIFLNLLLISFAFVSLSASGLRAAESPVCQTPTWVGTPAVGSDDVFHGKMSSDCVISGATGAGVASLAKYLIDETVKQGTVNVGPTAETFQNLPGFSVDVTDNDPNQEIQIRSIVHVASDSAGRLEYANLSTDIQGQGDSQFLRKLDVTVSITAGARTGDYVLTMTTALDVKRPWYAPSGVFEQKAEDSTKATFLQKRDKTVPEMAGQL